MSIVGIRYSDGNKFIPSTYVGLLTNLRTQVARFYNKMRVIISWDITLAQKSKISQNVRWQSRFNYLSCF